MAGVIDIDKPGKYKIVLSDALLGRGTKELFTSIRCTLRIVRFKELIQLTGAIGR